MSLNRSISEVVGPYPYQMQYALLYLKKWKWLGANWENRGTHRIPMILEQEDEDTFYDTAADALIGLLELWGRHECVVSGV